MTVRLSVVCKTPGCQAVHVVMEPLDITLSLFQALTAAVKRAESLGWVPSGGAQDGMVCPSCARGGSLVSDRGDCPVCMGKRLCRDNSDRCMFCKHTTAYPEGDVWDEI